MKDNVQTIVISDQDAGKRIDKVLAQTLKLSRREVLLLLEHTCISLNNHKLSLKSKGKLLEVGDKLIIQDYSQVLSTIILPNPDIHLEVLSKGDGYIVIDKPARMPVMPLKASETDTVLNALVVHYPNLQGIGEGGLRSGVVHRLDTDTSGTLVIATEEERWQSLRNAFKEHKTEKRYRAIVHGKLNGHLNGHLKGSRQETMTLVIAQHKPAKVKVLTRPEQANSSQRVCDLKWRSLEIYENATLVEVELGTGFLHQIRVMFAHMGHPVVGDSVYGEICSEICGENSKYVTATRQMLHAYSLKVLDIEATSPDPEDFSSLVEELKAFP